jgi:hypothetical protein
VTAVDGSGALVVVGAMVVVGKDAIRVVFEVFSDVLIVATGHVVNTMIGYSR